MLASLELVAATVNNLQGCCVCLSDGESYGELCTTGSCSSSAMVWTRLGRKKEAGVGVGAGVNDGVWIAVFPHHQTILLLPRLQTMPPRPPRGPLPRHPVPARTIRTVPETVSFPILGLVQ